ncbi:hypothetical protein K4749_32950 [Streptomyces sp. TRM72054]|nr:hypothetical protein [Streptomyces sp. TRM72054]
MSTLYPLGVLIQEGPRRGGAIGIPRHRRGILRLGTAAAVLMDAMVVRGLLVPAVMRLTGRAPRPLLVGVRLGEGESWRRQGTGLRSRDKVAAGG